MVCCVESRVPDCSASDHLSDSRATDAAALFSPICGWLSNASSQSFGSRAHQMRSAAVTISSRISKGLSAVIFAAQRLEPQHFRNSASACSEGIELMRLMASILFKNDPRNTRNDLNVNSSSIDPAPDPQTADAT